MLSLVLLSLSPAAVRAESLTRYEGRDPRNLLSLGSPTTKPADGRIFKNVENKSPLATHVKLLNKNDVNKVNAVSLKRNQNVEGGSNSKNGPDNRHNKDSPESLPITFNGSSPESSFKNISLEEAISSVSTTTSENSTSENFTSEYNLKITEHSKRSTISVNDEMGEPTSRSQSKLGCRMGSMIGDYLPEETYARVACYFCYLYVPDHRKNYTFEVNFKEYTFKYQVCY